MDIFLKQAKFRGKAYLALISIKAITLSNPTQSNTISCKPACICALLYIPLGSKLSHRPIPYLDPNYPTIQSHPMPHSPPVKQHVSAHHCTFPRDRGYPAEKMRRVQDAEAKRRDESAIFLDRLDLLLYRLLSLVQRSYLV